MARATSRTTTRRSPPRRRVSRATPPVTPPHRITVSSPPMTPIRYRPSRDAETPTMFRFLEDALGPDVTFTGNASVVRRLTYDEETNNDLNIESMIMDDETFVSTIIMNDLSFELVNSLDISGDFFVFGYEEEHTEISNE